MGSCYPAKANALLAEFFMKKASPRSHSSRGAALLLALWALFLLSAMVIAWALNINSGLTVSATANRALSAEAMASSGAEVALNPTIKPASANLVQALRQYLNIKGVDLNDLDVMMDSLLDWISPTKGLHHLNAPEETDDYRPPHAPLTSVDELKKVFGWAQYTSHPGWDQDFTTVNGGCQQIDAAYASRDVLRAFGIPDDFVDRFLQARRGADGIDGTADDPQMDQPTAFSLLGLPGGTRTSPQTSGTQIPITYKSPQPVFRIVSVGKCGNVTRSVQMIVLKQALGVGRPQVFSWKEL
jgi:hypothetical protein